MARIARRITVNLRPGDASRLDQLAEEAQAQPSEVIRRALATEAFVKKTLRAGRKILVQDEKGNLREVEFVHD
jgi:predicted transcriptional regulator